MPAPLSFALSLPTRSRNDSCEPNSSNSDGRRRRLSDAELTPEQRAAVKARRAGPQTPQYQDELARDIEAYRQEYPPVGDPELIAALAGLRANASDKD